MTTIERLPPHSVEAEDAVLGAILIDPDCFPEVSKIVDSGAFYRALNASLFSAIKTLFQNGRVIDLITVSDQLRRDPQFTDSSYESHIIGLLNAVPTSINATHYARIIHEAAIRREQIRLASQIANAAYSEMDTVESGISVGIFGLSNLLLRATPDKRVFSANDLVTAALDDSRKQPPIVTRTGLNNLDYYIDGIATDDFLFIGARPGDGKTALSFYTACQIAQTRRVDYYSYEMDADKLMSNAISARMKQDNRLTLSLLRYKTFSDYPQWLLEGLNWFSGLKLRVDNSSPNAGQIYANCTADRELCYVFIDNINDMPPVNDHSRNRLVEINESLSVLYGIPRQLHTGVVMTAHILREVGKRKEKKIQMDDFKETGRIEEMATRLIAIYHPGDSDKVGMAEILILKNRNGAIGTAECRWVPEWSSFRNVRRVE